MTTNFHAVRLMGCLALVCAALAGRQTATAQDAAPPVRIAFVPQSAEVATAVAEYESIWAEHGRRVAEAIERKSGLRFVTPEYADTAIAANVVEAPSNSGYRDRPMRLRASYTRATKLATLIHELGHRLQSGLFREDEEEHQYLFLWVYDVWVELQGKAWADEQVAIERRRGARYVRAWDEALRFTAAQRAERWRTLVAERTARPVDIRLEAGTALEQRGREQLERILSTWDLSRWLFTRVVRIQSRVIPHSHPVLTLNTQYLADDTAQATTFLHEQLHWFVSAHPGARDSALAELRSLYPQAPAGPPTGARDLESTYLHLIVCLLEFDSARELFGEPSARRTLGGWRHYSWIYQEVLERPGVIRAILRKYGLDSPDARG